MGKCCRRLRFYYKRLNTKINVDIVLPDRNFVKDRTPAKIFCCRFCEFLQPVILLKTKLRHRCFPVNFAKFLKLHILQNTCKGLWQSSDMIIARFFWKIYCSSNWKIRGYQRYCFLKMSMYLFNVFSKSFYYIDLLWCNWFLKTIKTSYIPPIMKTILWFFET